MDWFQQGDMESGMNLQGAWAKMAEGLIVFWILKKKANVLRRKVTRVPEWKPNPLSRLVRSGGTMKIIGSKEPSNWGQKGWSSRSPDSGRCELGLNTVPVAELVSELWQCSIHRRRESQDPSQQLPVTNIIISLCWGETAREIGTGVELLRTGVMLRENGWGVRMLQTTLGFSE